MLNPIKVQSIAICEVNYNLTLNGSSECIEDTPADTQKLRQFLNRLKQRKNL